MEKKNFLLLQLVTKESFIKMKLRILNIIASLFVASCVITSCLDDDAVEYEYSSNASITAFAITDSIVTSYQATVNGKDTTLTTAVVGAKYPFVIDQNSGNIYNPDSLPVGTDLSKVVVNITADNYVFIAAETDSVWESTDSLDFRNPIRFKVLSQAGIYGKIYTAQINVHRQEPDSMVWTRLAGNDFSKDILKQKAIYRNGHIYVFAEQNGQVSLTTTSIDNGRTWTPLQPTNLPAQADLTSVMAWGGQFYMLAGEALYTSTDALAWTKVETEQTFGRLIAASDCGAAKLIGTDTENHYIESADGFHWTQSGKLPENFPTSNHASVSYELNTNPSFGRIVLIGNESLSSDTTNTVWSQLTNEKDWTDITPANLNNACPNLENASLIRYDNKLYTFGGKGQDGKELTPFCQMYESADNGITWAAVTKRTMFPEAFGELYEQAKGNYSCIVDNQQRIWLMWSRTGEVWRGRINRLGFDRQ